MRKQTLEELQNWRDALDPQFKTMERNSLQLKAVMDFIDAQIAARIKSGEALPREEDPLEEM